MLRGLVGGNLAGVTHAPTPTHLDDLHHPVYRCDDHVSCCPMDPEREPNVDADDEQAFGKPESRLRRRRETIKSTNQLITVGQFGTPAIHPSSSVTAQPGIANCKRHRLRPRDSRQQACLIPTLSRSEGHSHTPRTHPTNDPTNNAEEEEGGGEEEEEEETYIPPYRRTNVEHDL